MITNVYIGDVYCIDTWNTPRIAQAFVKMAENGRAKVKEVIKYKLSFFI